MSVIKKMYMPSCSLENFWKLFLVLIGLGIIEYEFINSDLKENLLIRFSYTNNGTKNEIETNQQLKLAVLLKT